MTIDNIDARISDIEQHCRGLVGKPVNQDVIKTLVDALGNLADCVSDLASEAIRARRL